METPAQGDVILDKYTVERKLGRGGMGVVVAARHRHLGELLALKFITGMCTPEAMERFWREGRAGAQLRGQHIARVYDLGHLPNGVPYMVMEYLRGSDLKTLLNRDGPFPVADAIRYVVQACEALGEAHDAGIIHRDIKPSNLLLWDRPYGEPCIKVLDFGISKHRFHDDETLTLTKGFLGSPQYMAPEQIASPKDVDARADIWSLGVVLYEILAGTSPFQGSSIIGVINKVVKDEPKPLRNHRPELPAGLESVVKRCLRKAADDRYQRIEDLAEALVEVQENLATPQTRRAQQSSTIMQSERSQEHGQPVPKQVSEDAVTSDEAATSMPSSIDVTFTSNSDPLEIPTVRVREGVVVPQTLETIDLLTISTTPHESKLAAAQGIDTTTHKMQAKSALEINRLDRFIIPVTDSLGRGSAEFASSSNVPPPQTISPPLETVDEMRQKLRPSRFTLAGTVMIVCIIIVLLVSALSYPSTPDPGPSESVPKPNETWLVPIPPAPMSEGSVNPEIPAPPKPRNDELIPSASVKVDKQSPPQTSATTRTTKDKPFNIKSAPPRPPPRKRDDGMGRWPE